MKKITRISILAGIAGVIIGAGILLYMLLLGTVRTSSIERYETAQKLFARNLATDIEEFYVDIEKRLDIIALFPTVKNAERSEQCNLGLQQIVEANSETFSNLGRIDKDGMFVCAVNRSIVGEKASKYGTYYQQIKDDPEHKPVMSRLIYPTGSAEGVIAVHVPVFNDKDEFDGTIGGAVYFSEFEKHLLNEVKVSQNSFIVLHDNNGDILYHPDPLIRGKNVTSEEMLSQFTPRKIMEDFGNAVKKGTSGELRYSLRGEPRVSMYEPAQVLGRHWTAIVAVPQKDQDSIASDSRFQGLLAGTIAILCVSFMAAAYYSPTVRTKLSVVKE